MEDISLKLSKFNAILFSNRSIVELNRIPDDVRKPVKDYDGPSVHDLYQIRWQRFDVRYFPRIQEARKATMQEMLKYLKFAFMDGERDPFTGIVDLERRTYAYTTVEPDERFPVDKIWIHLNMKAYKPLLRNDLTDSERLGLIWLNATTIVHEW